MHLRDNCKNEYTFGYLYDLWLFSAEARLADAVGLNTDILNCRVAEYAGRSDFAFPICDSSGIFIDVTSSQCEVGGTVFIKKREKRESPYFAPPWLNADEKADVHYVEVDNDYKEAIINVIRTAVDMSPLRKVYMLIRRQCRERKNIIGMLTLEEVGKLVADDRILGNTVYVIYDKPDCLHERQPFVE